MFGCHGHSRNCKLTTVKQKLTNSPSNDRKITSDNILKLRFSKSSRDLIRDFEFQGYLPSQKLSIAKEGMLH